MFSQQTTEEILAHIDQLVSAQCDVREGVSEGMVLPIESVLRTLLDYRFIEYTDYEYFLDQLGALPYDKRG